MKMTVIPKINANFWVNRLNESLHINDILIIYFKLLCGGAQRQNYKIFCLSLKSWTSVWVNRALLGHS